MTDLIYVLLALLALGLPAMLLSRPGGSAPTSERGGGR